MKTGKRLIIVFLEVNPIFEKQTGLTNVVGKTMRELADNIEEYWFEIFGEVARYRHAATFSARGKTIKPEI